jgi:two-component system response regulator RegX3
MHAVLRRAPRPGPDAGGVAHPSDTGARDVGDVRVDSDRHRVFVRGQEVHLRRKEFELLALLIENPGRVLTRDTLIDRVWGTDYVGDTKTLDVHIKRLRTHVERDPSAPSIITTVRGVGYRFEVPTSEPAITVAPPR